MTDQNAPAPGSQQSGDQRPEISPPAVLPPTTTDQKRLKATLTEKVRIRRDGKKYSTRNRALKRKLADDAYLLRLRGATYAEIGLSLGIPENTIRYWLDEARRFNEAEFRQFTADRVAKQFWLSAKERTRHLWHIYNNAGNNLNVKIGAMKAIREEEQIMIETAQSLGLIFRAPVRIEATVRRYSEVQEPELVDLLRTRHTQTVTG